MFLDKRGALQMSGTHITNHQIRLFMQSKQEGKTIEVAAARAGFSERSAYRIQNPERNLKTKYFITILKYYSRVIPFI